MIGPWTRTWRVAAYGIVWMLLLATATLAALRAQPSSSIPLRAQQPPPAAPAPQPGPGQPPSAPTPPGQQPPPETQPAPPSLSLIHI